MGELISKYWLELLLGLISAGALSFCKYLWGQAKEYKKLTKLQEEEKINCMIETQIQPIVEEIEELRDYIRKTENTERHHIKLIISSYKFRLVQLCKIHIRNGYLTQDDYDQLSEFYRLYENLGGNG
jgi:hypothetical protein